MSKERKDLGTTLALEAIMKRNSSAPFTLYVTMDIKKPETIENFAAFGEMLADAYDKGAAAEWFDASALPPDSRPVLVECEPLRKNGKPVFVVGSYFRTKKGEHDAEPEWCDGYGDDMKPVRWQYITPYKE